MQFITDLKAAQAAKFSFERYKVGAGTEMGDGAPRWSADVMLAGVKIGSVNDDGDGSPCTIGIPVAEQDRLVAALKAAGYVLDLKVPGTTYVLDEPKTSHDFLDLALQEFANHYDTLKFWKSKCKTKSIFRLKGAQPDDFLHFKEKCSVEVGAMIRKRYGDELDLIMNEAIAGL